jgi:low affinity Fe/Cu permease
VSPFDRFAERCADIVASAAFFSFCVLLCVLWAPSLPLFGSVDTWQLVINTITTVVTFLLVALLQNTQRRFEQATDEREDALAEAVACLLRRTGDAHCLAIAERLHDARGDTP